MLHHTKKKKNAEKLEEVEELFKMTVSVKGKKKKRTRKTTVINSKQDVCLQSQATEKNMFVERRRPEHFTFVSLFQHAAVLSRTFFFFLAAGPNDSC